MGRGVGAIWGSSLALRLPMASRSLRQFERGSLLNEKLEAVGPIVSALLLPLEFAFSPSFHFHFPFPVNRPNVEYSSINIGTPTSIGWDEIRLMSDLNLISFYFLHIWLNLIADQISLY